MAKRPVFIPTPETFPFVTEKLIEFEWYPGFSKAQTQKSIYSLHKSAEKFNIEPVLEISSKSSNSLGVALSAFNLTLSIEKHKFSVESIYQGSKIFSGGGPFTDLYYLPGRDAKKDERIRNSGDFIGYKFFGEVFPHNPVTAFYDWLYVTALSQNLHLAEKLLEYKGFSDIVFNPKKSLNCQAKSAALFVSLKIKNEIDFVLQDKRYYLNLMSFNAETNDSLKNLQKDLCQLELF